MISLLHVLYDVRRQAKSVGPVVLGLRRFFTLLVSTTGDDCQGPGMLCGVYQQGLLEDRARLPKQFQSHHCPLCVNVQPPHHPSTQAPIYSSAHVQHRYTSNKKIQHAHNRASAQTVTLKSHCPAATHADSPHISNNTFPQQHKSTIASMPTTKSVAPKATQHTSPTMHLPCDPTHNHKCTHIHTSTIQLPHSPQLHSRTVPQPHNSVLHRPKQPHDATASTTQHEHSPTSRNMHYSAVPHQHIQTALYTRSPI